MRHQHRDPPAATTPPSGLRPAVFFDRDGVVNLRPPHGEFVTRWGDFRFTPGIIRVLSLCRARGFVLVLVTNQRGVATGALDAATLADIHDRMQSELSRHGAAFDAIYAASGDRDDPRRKPNPDMLFEAARDLGLDLARSILIGDASRDVQAGNAAGIPITIQLLGEKPVSPKARHRVPDAASLEALLDSLS